MNKSILTNDHIRIVNYGDAYTICLPTSIQLPSPMPQVRANLNYIVAE